MEGVPEFSKVKEEILSNPSIKKVKFVPFMLTFGDHMSNDVFGDEPDSFKSQLGLPAEIGDGMASNPKVQKLFIDRAKIVYGQF
jgi:sirohydrochlorin cobaltochelatase